MQTELIIFDWDGTLVDSESVHIQAACEVLVDLGLTHYTSEYYAANFTGLTRKMLVEKVFTELDGKVPAEHIFEGILNRFHELQSNVKIVDGVFDLLSVLDKPVCIASNSERITLLRMLEITGLDAHFNEASVFTYNQVAAAKPAPDLFLHAAREMSVPPESCLVIEDSPAGVKGAMAAGMRVIGFTGTYNDPLAKAEELMQHGAENTIAHWPDLNSLVA